MKLLMSSPHFEISDRFRKAVEAKILRLEQGASFDREQLPWLATEDHRNRQNQLIDAQIAEAVRLRARLSFAGAIPSDFLVDALCATQL